MTQYRGELLASMIAIWILITAGFWQSWILNKKTAKRSVRRREISLEWEIKSWVNPCQFIQRWDIHHCYMLVNIIYSLSEFCCPCLSFTPPWDSTSSRELGIIIHSHSHPLVENSTRTLHQESVLRGMSGQLRMRTGQTHLQPKIGNEENQLEKMDWWTKNKVGRVKWRQGGT